MAGIITKGNTYYAIFYANGKKVKRSTGVKVKQAGFTNRQLANLARQQAERLEAIANGDAMVDKQIDALRAAAEAAGSGAKYPQYTTTSQHSSPLAAPRMSAMPNVPTSSSFNTWEQMQPGVWTALPGICAKALLTIRQNTAAAAP